MKETDEIAEITEVTVPQTHALKHLVTQPKRYSSLEQALPTFVDIVAKISWRIYIIPVR